MLDAAGLGVDPAARARAIFAAGADWIQLRDRRISDAALLAVARSLVDAREAARPEAGARGERLRVIVNKRVDLARVAGADGVHLGFDALGVAEARALLGPREVLGRSLHTAAEVHEEAAREVRADYVHLAPIWDPNSKPAERPALGSGALEEAARAGLPVFAQGGLDPARASEAIAAGAAGIAVTGDLARGAPPEAFLASFRLRLDGHR